MNTSPIAPVVLLAIVVVAALAVMALVLRRAMHAVPTGRALVVTRSSGPPRVHFSNALVIPIVQRAEWVDLSPMEIVVDRRGAEGIFCLDNIRIDVRALFRVRVGPTAEEVLAVASQVGCARATDRETVEQRFCAKFAETLKIVARRHDFLELAGAPGAFRDEVAAELGERLDGYRLDSVEIERLEHTSIDALDRRNVLDAQGVRKLEKLLEAGAVPPPVSSVDVQPSPPPPTSLPASSPDALLPGPSEPRTLLTCDVLDDAGASASGALQLRLEPSAPARIELRRGVRTLSSVDLTLPLAAHLSVSPAADGSLDGARLLLTLRQRASGSRQELAVAADLAGYLAALPASDAASASEAAGALPRLRAEAVEVSGPDLVRVLAAVRFVREAAGETRWV